MNIADNFRCKKELVNAIEKHKSSFEIHPKNAWKMSLRAFEPSIKEAKKRKCDLIIIYSGLSTK